MIHKEFVDSSSFFDGDRIAIYGFGGRGLELYDDLKSSGRKVEIAFFIDSYKESKFNGIPVYKFSDLSLEHMTGVKIVVASIFWQEILQNLSNFPELDVQVYNPNLKTNIPYYFSLITKIVKETLRLKLFNLDELINVGTKPIKVFHSDPNYTPLGLSGTVFERQINHHSESEIRSALSFEQNVDIVLCPRTDIDLRFFYHILRLIPSNSRVFIGKPTKRYTKAFIMEEASSIFIPVPKCATTSILSLLQSRYDDGTKVHGFSNISSPLQIIDVDTFDFSKYFTFSFVRNPLSRVASIYKKNIDKYADYRHDALCRYFGKNKLLFSDVAEFICSCADAFSDVHFRSQSEFLIKSDGTLCVDFLGRLENFQSDWKTISEKIGIPVISKKRNVSGLNAKILSNYYTKDLEKSVRKRYERDFELLNP